MKCIMGQQCNCINNYNGVCKGRPERRELGCLGTVCWNIQPE